MRAARWIVCVVAACAAVAAVVGALALPPRMADPGAADVRAPLTIQGRVLDAAGAREITERFTQALHELLGGRTPPAALGAGVIAAARAKAGLYANGAGGLENVSLTLEPEGWRESNGAAYVTVDGGLAWTTPSEGEDIESSTAMPMLLKLTSDGGRWDVESAQGMPDGGVYDLGAVVLAPWATGALVAWTAAVLGLGALLFLCFPRLASRWRAALVVPAVLATVPWLLLADGAPDSASGGQGNSALATILVERPLVPPAGWALPDDGSFQAYADALHTFFWLLAVLLAAVALAAVPPRRGADAPVPGIAQEPGGQAAAIAVAVAVGQTAEGGRRAQRAAP
jgi:hypothetical protein